MRVKYRIRSSGNLFSLHLATVDERSQTTIGYIHWNPNWHKKIGPGLFLVAPVFITKWRYQEILEEGYIEDPIPFLDRCPDQKMVSYFRRDVTV